MSHVRFQLLTHELPQWAALANACAVSPGSVRVDFHPQGEYRYDVVQILVPESELAHFMTMHTLMGSPYMHEPVCAETSKI